MKAIRIAVAVLFLIAAAIVAPMVATTVTEAPAVACSGGVDC
jgi:hypothetical protein